MRIGISVITRAGQNIWENGIGQNVIFLALLLQRLPFVSNVVLLDVGDQHAMPQQVDNEAMGIRLMLRVLRVMRLTSLLKWQAHWIPSG